MNADDIVKMLREKHANDVFVAECKNGASWTKAHRRLDVWVMNRSWVKMCLTGYEIKVHRSDFINDDKWHNYLPLCNRLWFVAPKGVVSPADLPSEVGLMVPCGSRLITKKPAPFRKVEPPAELLCYILMSRATIDAPKAPVGQTEWRKWLEDCKADKFLGFQVSRALRERVERAERKAAEADKRLAAVQETVDWCQQNSIPIGSIGYHRQRMSEFARGIPEGMEWSLERAQAEIGRLLGFIKRIQIEGSER